MPLQFELTLISLKLRYLVSKNARLDICNNDSDLPVDLVDSSNVQIKEYIEEEMRNQCIDIEYEKQKEELLMLEDAQKLDFKERIHAKTGATPLHVAAAKGYLRVIETLLQRGVNVNAIDNDRWTPLHAAAHWEQEEACRILAQNGADFTAQTYSGQTPYDVCDKEMSVKLRNLQSTYSNQKASSPQSENNQKDGQQRLADVTSLNNQFKLDSRSRRQSDESKSSISRLPIEVKLTLSDREKKQEKNLLSPSSLTTSNKNNFDMFNSDSECGKNTF